MFNIYGRDTSAGGYKSIIASDNFPPLKGSVFSSDLKTLRKAPGFIHQAINGVMFFAAVVPHDSTPSEPRPHCVTHLIGLKEELQKAFFWKALNNEMLLNCFFTGTENEAKEQPECLTTNSVLSKAYRVNHVKDKPVTGIESKCQKLLLYIKINKASVFLIQTSPRYEEWVFQYLARNLNEPVSLNLVSHCRISINGRPSSCFFETIHFEEPIPEPHIAYDVDSFEIDEYRKKLIQAYRVFDDTNLADTFWSSHKNELSEIIRKRPLVFCRKDIQILVEIILFLGERSPHTRQNLLDSKISFLSSVYDFTTISETLNQFSFSLFQRKRIQHHLKKQTKFLMAGGHKNESVLSS